MNLFNKYHSGIYNCTKPCNGNAINKNGKGDDLEAGGRDGHYPEHQGVFVFNFQVLRVATGRNVSVAEGKELDLTCNITTDRVDDVRPEVTWYFSRTPGSTVPGPRVLARLDRESLVHSSPHVALSHVDARSYHLLVRDVSKENSGYYFCHVALWAPGHNRSWHKVAEAMSAPAGVDVTWLGEWFGGRLSAPLAQPFLGAMSRQGAVWGTLFWCSWCQDEHTSAWVDPPLGVKAKLTNRICQARAVLG